MAMTKDLGALLVDEGIIDSDQLSLATAEQEKEGRSLGRVLIDMKLVSETTLVEILARHVGLEYVDLGDVQLDPTVVGLIPEQVARRYHVIPIGWDDETLIVAMSDPSNVLAL